MRLSPRATHAALLPRRVRRLHAGEELARSRALNLEPGKPRSRPVYEPRSRTNAASEHTDRTFGANSSKLSHEISTARYLSEGSAHARLGRARGPRRLLQRLQVCEVRYQGQWSWQNDHDRSWLSILRPDHRCCRALKREAARSLDRSPMVRTVERSKVGIACPNHGQITNCSTRSKLANGSGTVR